MANQIGVDETGFSEGAGAALRVLASDFTAPASFTPNHFHVRFSESWGVGGTCYVAIYDDSSGPNTVLWSGSKAYSAIHGGRLYIPMTSPPSLTSGNTYWLCAYWENSSGSFLIFANTSSAARPIKTWDETIAGSWTATPTISDKTANEELAIYAIDDAQLSVSQSVSVSESFTVFKDVPADLEPNISDSVSVSESPNIAIAHQLPNTYDKTVQGVVITTPN